MIRFTLGSIKFGDRPTAAAPSEGPGLDIGTVTPEEASLTPAAQNDGRVTTLCITDIEPYERNPRQAANPLFDTIKASIRQRGMDAPLSVTRRPGATHYVVAAGGNTRLLAQLQLWQETTDPRFETVPVVIKAWRSESDVLAGHLIENEQRSDLTFWDKARGVVALKTELEQEGATALSLRQWESALADLGLPIGKNVLSSYLFAVERLAPLGSAVATLSRNDVRGCLQPRFRTLGRLAQKFGLGETALYAHTLDPVMRRFAENFQATQTFAAAELAEEGDRALAQALQIAVPELEAMLALLDQSPELALIELRTRTAGATVAAPVRTELTIPRSRERDAGADPDPGAVSPGDRRGPHEDAAGSRTSPVQDPHQINAPFAPSRPSWTAVNSIIYFPGAEYASGTKPNFVGQRSATGAGLRVRGVSLTNAASCRAGKRKDAVCGRASLNWWSKPTCGRILWWKAGRGMRILSIACRTSGNAASNPGRSSRPPHPPDRRSPSLSGTLLRLGRPPREAYASGRSSRTRSSEAWSLRTGAEDGRFGN